MADGAWHKVSQGEWMTKIAARYGIVNWKQVIWQHPENAKLALCRDPNILFPGDRVFIPAPKQKELECGTDQSHSFVLETEHDEFRLTVKDADDKPIRDESYVLQIGNQVFKGTTDGDGGINASNVLPFGSSHDGSIEFPRLCIVIPITVGSLNPHQEGSEPSYDDGVSGIKMRLYNLGFNPGDMDSDDDEEFRQAVEMFQIIEMGRSPDAVNGQLDDDTRKTILKLHGA